MLTTACLCCVGVCTHPLFFSSFPPSPLLLLFTLLPLFPFKGGTWYNAAGISTFIGCSITEFTGIAGANILGEFVAVGSK